MEEAPSAASFGGGRSAPMQLLTRTPGARRDPIPGRTLPRQQRHHNDKSMGGSGGGPSTGPGGGGAPGAAAVDSGASNGFYSGGAALAAGDAAPSGNNGSGNFPGDGAGGGGDFARGGGGKGKGAGKGGKGGPMRVPRGRGDNRDRDNRARDHDSHRGYKERDIRGAPKSKSDNDSNWRARTVEEANAAINAMQGAPPVRPGQRPQAATAQPTGPLAADANSPREPDIESMPEQESPVREVWPALGSGVAPPVEAENLAVNPGQIGGNSNAVPASLLNCCAQAIVVPAPMAGSPAMGPSGPAAVLTMGTSPAVMLAMPVPYGAGVDNQSMAPDEAALQARPTVKAPPQPSGLGGPAAGLHGLANPNIAAGGTPNALGAAGGNTGASAQKPMLPVKASTKAYARSNAKAATPKEVPNKAAASAAVSMLVPSTMPPDNGASGGAPGPSSGGATLGIGPDASAKAAPAPVVMPTPAALPPAPAAGGGPANLTSGSGNNEATVEAGEGDGSELKTLLGRGAAPPSGDVDAKLGRGGVRLQGVEDWVLYLQPQREGEAQQSPAPVRRAVAGARGRGRGRLVNLRLDRVRGAGRATAPVMSGEDGREAATASEATEEVLHPAPETPAPEPANTSCVSTGDGNTEATAMPAAGTSSSSQAAAAPSAPFTQNGAPAMNSWTPQASASAALGRGGSSMLPSRRRGRAWEDMDGMLDIDGEDGSQNSAAVGTSAVSSTSDGSSLPASSGPSTSVAERRTRSPPTASAGASCLEEHSEATNEEGQQYHQGSPAAPSTAAAQASEVQASEEGSQTATGAGVASAVSSTSCGGSNVAASGTAERRPPCSATGSANESSLEASPAVASTAAPAQASETQASEASSSSTSPASAGAAPSSTATSTRPRPEASTATPATASSAAPALGASTGGASGLMRLAMDIPPATGEAAAGPWAGAGGWERNFRRDDELLRACGLWCKKVEADGACLFRAFSDQLEGDGGSMHLKYRDTCVTYLEEYRADFEPFIDSNFKGYCAKLREPAAWGGHVEAQALSRALGVNALIHLPAEAEAAEDVPEKAIEVLNFGEDAPCVQLCFHPRYHSGPHYNSVRCSGDKGDGVPLATGISELRERMLEVLRTRRQRQGGTAP